MVHVIKATGDIEPFSEEKVRQSIKRAGIPPEIEDQVAAHVVGKIYDNIPTSEIYRHILEFLGKSSLPYAKGKYSLKQAIMALGPTGYPFEDFFAEILKAQGYITRTRVILSGKCVNHEVDVLAQKGLAKEDNNSEQNAHIMVEAKFHNMPGTKTDVHVALYTKARFDDIKDKNSVDHAWLVTNTKASTDAVAFANCAGIRIISWNYPETDSLRDMIEKANLVPVTMLTTLSQNQQKILLEGHVVLCRHIYESPGHLDVLNLAEDKKKEVLSEIDYLISQKKAERPVGKIFLEAQQI